MYNLEIKEQAFVLYAQGLGCQDVALEMRKKYPKICPKLKRHTVDAWSKKYQWEKRKKKVHKAVANQVDQNIVSDRLETISQLRTLRDRIFDHLPQLKIKSFEGGVYCLNNVLKRLDDMTGESGKYGFRGDITRVVMVIFAVLGEDNRIAPILKEREQYLLAQIEQRIQQEEPKRLVADDQRE